MTSIFNISWEYPRKHVLCKLGDSSPVCDELSCGQGKVYRRTYRQTDRRRQRQYQVKYTSEIELHHCLITYVHTFACTCTHARTHTCTHTHTPHTHTHPYFWYSPHCYDLVSDVPKHLDFEREWPDVDSHQQIPASVLFYGDLFWKCIRQHDKTNCFSPASLCCDSVDCHSLAQRVCGKHCESRGEQY